MYAPSIIKQPLCYASDTCCPRPCGCITAGLLGKLQACRFYRLGQGRAEFLKHTFRFSCQQPLGVNPVTDLAEACSPFALFITDSPRLSLSKTTFIFFQFGSCWFARGLGTCCRCRRGAGSEAWVSRGPRRGGTSLRRWAQISDRLFCWQRECGFASEPGTGLGFGSTLCAADAGWETGGIFLFSP